MTRNGIKFVGENPCQRQIFSNPGLALKRYHHTAQKNALSLSLLYSCFVPFLGLPIAIAKTAHLMAFAFSLANEDSRFSHASICSRTRVGAVEPSLQNAAMAFFVPSTS